MYVMNELRATVHCRVRKRIEVADDDVGLQLQREQRVGAAVNRDLHGPVLRECTDGVP